MSRAEKSREDYTAQPRTSSVSSEGARMANPKVALEPNRSASKEAGIWPGVGERREEKK